jgi:RNA polymerase sigma-70 factor (ECF subfamily)
MFSRHGRSVYLYCASRVGATAAEDIVADTFLVAYERRHRFTPQPGVSGSALPWLFGIASNLLRRHRRDETRALRALARTGVDPLIEEGFADGAAARLDASAQVRQVAAVLARLPSRQREVLLLHAVAEQGYAEIAAALGIPIGSVQSALHRARTKVRAALSAAPQSSKGSR